MKRSSLNFIVDLAGFIDLLGMVLTGLIMKYILPPGSGGLGCGRHGGCGGEHIRHLWSMGRHDWGNIHFWLAVLFIVLMIVHIILHWSWIKNYLKSLFDSSQQH